MWSMLEARLGMAMGARPSRRQRKPNIHSLAIGYSEYISVPQELET